MTQDHYRPSIPFSEIIRESKEVQFQIANASVTASGEDMEAVIRKSIEVGVRLCGFDISFSGTVPLSRNNNETQAIEEGLHE